MAGEDSYFDTAPNILCDDKSCKFPYKAGSTTLDGHLKQPITDDEQRFILEVSLENTKKCRTHREIKQLILEENIQHFIYDTCPSPWHCLTKYIKSQANKSKKNYSEQYKQTCEIASRYYTLQKQVCNPDIEVDTDEYNDHLRQVYDDLILLEYYKYKNYVETMKELFVRSRVTYSEFIKLTPDLRISKNHIIFNCPDHKICLGPTSLLLGVLDILQCRFNQLTYWKFSDYFKKYPTALENNVSMFNIGYNILTTIESLYPILGEKLFQLLKLWEPFVIGVICSDEERDVGYKGLLHSTMIELEVFGKQINLHNLLNLWVFGRDDDEIKMALEFSSLNRSFGHPCVKDALGKGKVAEIAGAPPTVDPDMLVDISNQFKRIFCEGYLDKHRRWPDLEFVSPPNLILYKVYNENRWFNEDEMDKLPHGAWSAIQFKKCFEFNYSPQTAELISDKSCSAPLPYWTQHYDSCGFRHHHNQEKPRLPFQETRVIHRFLKGKPNEVREIVTEIDQGIFRHDSLINILCRKERELNIDGRWFTKQDYMTRLAQTSAEANINLYINPCVKHQTMSDDEAELGRKIGSISRLMVRHDTENINLDLWKWNMTQCHEVCKPIAQSIDKLFGFNEFYQNAHLHIQSCYILGNSRVNPPKIGPTGLPELGFNCYTNQYGGLEGMRQKLWTLITTCIITKTAEDLNLQIYILGQGDNQVITIKWSAFQLKDRDLLREQFLTRLRDNFLRCNMLLKSSETWVSSRLTEYAKNRWLYGTAASNGTKRASRIISHENDGISTLDTSLATISTATEAISRTDWQPDNAFLMYGWEIANLLFLRGIYTIKHDFLSKFSLLFFPNCLGGINLSTFLNHSVRGFDDSLTIWISILLHVKKEYTELYSYICRLVTIKKKSTVNPSQLLTDIFSLNIISLRVPSLLIQEYVDEHLPKITTNSEILDMLNLESATNYDDIAIKLSSSSPFYAPILHEMIRNSNSGIIKSFKSRFSNVGTLLKLTQESLENDIYLEVIHADNEIVEGLKARICIDKRSFFKRNRDNMRLSEYLNSSTCPYKIALKLRAETWDKEILGVTHTPPYHQGKICNWDILTDIEKTKSIHIVISEKLFQNQNIYKYTIGPFPSYRGSNTPVKAIGAPIKLLNPNPFLKSIKNLLELKSWLMRAEAFYLINILDSLIDEKLVLMPDDFDKNQIQLLGSEIYGGCFYHRFRSISESRGALINSLESLSSYFKTNTNSMTFFTTKGEDYNIFFQMIFLHIQSAIESYLLHDLFLLKSQQLGYLFTCDECTHKFEDVNIIGKTTDNLNIVNVQKYCSEIYDLFILKLNDLSRLELLRVSSICVGLQIARASDQTLTTRFAESQILGIVISPETQSSINIPQIKTSYISYLISGLIMGSKLIKLDLIRSLRGDKNLPTTIYNTLGGLMMTANRLNEFLVLTNTPLVNYNDTQGFSYAGATLGKAIRYYFNLNFMTFITNLIKYQFNNEDFVNKSSVYHFLVQVILIKCINSNYSKIDILRDEKIKYQQESNNILSQRNQLTIQIKRNKIDNLEVNELINNLRDLTIQQKNKSQEIKTKNLSINTAYSQIEACKSLQHILHQRNLFNRVQFVNFVKKIPGGSEYLPSNVKSIQVVGLEEVTQVWKSNMVQDPFDFFSDSNPERPVYIPSTIKTPEISDFSQLTVSVISDCEVITELPHYKIARYYSVPFRKLSSGCSYIASILGRLPKLYPSSIICLADGSGSISAFVSHMYPSSTIYYNTLVNPSVNNVVDFLNPIPASVMGDKHIHLGNNFNYKTLSTGETNILTYDFQEKMFKILPEIELLIIDMESEFVLDYELLYPLIFKAIDQLHSLGVIICKMRINLSIHNMIQKIDKKTVYCVKPLQVHMNKGYMFIIITSLKLNLIKYQDASKYWNIVSDDISYIPTIANVGVSKASNNSLCLDYPKYINASLKESMILTFAFPDLSFCFSSSLIITDTISYCNTGVLEIILDIIQIIVDMSWERITKSNPININIVMTRGRSPLLYQYIDVIILLVLFNHFDDLIDSDKQIEVINFIITHTVEIEEIHVDPYLKLINKLSIKFPTDCPTLFSKGKNIIKNIISCIQVGSVKRSVLPRRFISHETTPSKIKFRNNIYNQLMAKVLTSLPIISLGN